MPYSRSGLCVDVGGGLLWLALALPTPSADLRLGLCPAAPPTGPLPPCSRPQPLSRFTYDQIKLLFWLALNRLAESAEAGGPFAGAMFWSGTLAGSNDDGWVGVKREEIRRMQGQAERVVGFHATERHPGRLQRRRVGAWGLTPGKEW